jgi:hypothetical protein
LPDDLELLGEVSAPVVSDYPYGNAAAAQRHRPIDASTCAEGPADRSGQPIRSATSGGKPPVATGPQLVGVIRISDLP